MKLLFQDVLFPVICGLKLKLKKKKIIKSNTAIAFFLSLVISVQFFSIALNDGPAFGF